MCRCLQVDTAYNSTEGGDQALVAFEVILSRVGPWRYRKRLSVRIEYCTVAGQGCLDCVQSCAEKHSTAV